MSTTTAHNEPITDDSLPDPALYPSPFNLHPSGGRCRPPKSFHPFNDTLRNSSTKLDDMLEELDLSQDETEALLASTKYQSHRKLRTQLLSQQLTIAAQDHAQHALGTLLKLTDSNHAAIARLAATQLLAYANLQPPAPTPTATPPTTPEPLPPTPPFIIYNSEFSISPHSLSPPQKSPGTTIPAAPPAAGLSSRSTGYTPLMATPPASPSPPTVAESLRQETQRKKSRIASSLWPKARLLVEILYHQIVHDRTFTQAAALTYKTLFSLLPVCVLSLLVLSTISHGGGTALDSTMQEMVFKQLSLDKLVVRDAQNRPVIDQTTHRPLTARTFITPLLVKAKEAVTRPTTGIIAFGILLYGSISLMTVIESTFNYIYGGVRPRSWPRRIMLYWCVLTLGPIFIASSILAGRLAYSTATGYTETHLPAATAQGPATAEADEDTPAAVPAATAADPDAPATLPAAIEETPAKHAPGLSLMNIAAGFLLSWALTFFMYKVIPDTRVDWWSALIGSGMAAILWEFCKWGFSVYVNHALRSSWYGSLVLIPLFMLWIYLTWSAILLGLQVAYMHQFFPLLRRRYFFTRFGANVIADVRWVLSLGILLHRRFALGKGIHPHEAAEQLMLPNETTIQLLDGLEVAGLVHVTRNNAYTLARPPETITAHDLLTAARALCQVPPEIARENPIVQTYPQSRAISHLAELESRWAKQQTLKELAEHPDDIHLVAGPSTALIGAAAPAAG